MPLYKRKPFDLVEKPDDLNPEELVFQIRFTKEIFRDYNEYLKRINLYSIRVWTCKATGKGSLTYEEALVSEGKASKRIQNIPTQCVAPILRDVQFSMLNLQALVNSIAAKFQGPFSEGTELYGKKLGRLHLCKIIKVVEDAHATQYEIEWLDGNQKMSRKAKLNENDLTDKNPLFSKRVLKSFVKESTYRSLPWVLHDNLAKKHGISTSLPEELKSHCSVQSGLVICSGKRKINDETRKAAEANEKDIMIYMRRHKLTSEASLPVNIAEGVNPQDEESIKYPIDDLLVKRTDEDRLLTERPSPCRDFSVPMNFVADLLMVWDFCASFGKLLNLFPFSLQDFENSICYRDSTPSLIVESCSALLHLLVKDNGNFTTVIENKKRKPKITPNTWTEYLCDFLQTTRESPEFTTCISIIKRGHYALLEINVKLAIFRELIDHVLETDTVKDRLDDFVDEIRALSAARRDEVLDEGKKRREEKERMKLEGEDVKDERKTKSTGGNHRVTNGITRERSDKKVCSRQSYSSGTSENELGDNASKKNAKKRKVETSISLEDVNNPSKREIHKLMKNEVKETIEMKSAEERKQFLEREIEKRSIRTSPLGKDRDFYRYWFFGRDGRIFVENSQSTLWGYYQNKEEVDALVGSLNTKGVREKALKKQLQKFYDRICAGLEILRSNRATEEKEMEEGLVRRSTRVRAQPEG